MIQEHTSSTPGTGWVEVFRTERGAVYQCDANRCLILEFWDTHTVLSARDFSAFRRMVQTVDLRQMALSTDSAHDVEILTPPRSERCYVLTLCEVVHLRELLNGTQWMLELNSMLRECGCAPA